MIRSVKVFKDDLLNYANVILYIMSFGIVFNWFVVYIYKRVFDAVII